MSNEKVTLHVYLKGGSEIHVPSVDRDEADRLVTSFKIAMASEGSHKSVIQINSEDSERAVRGDMVIGYERTN